MAVKNNHPYLSSALKASVSVSNKDFPLSKSLSPVSKDFMRARYRVGKPYA